MNAMRERQLELLKFFISVCEQLELKWFCVCGTALGAVKYGGYIPWDDDIDVALPREDYDKFVEKASALLPEHIFVQNYQTDSAFPHVFSKLRNSNTTQLEASVQHLMMNHGIYIDIFPLDGYPSSKHTKIGFELQNKILSWKQFCFVKHSPNRRIRIRNFLFRLMGYHKKTAQVIMQKEKLYKRFSLAQSVYWCNYGNWQKQLEYAHYTQYGNGTNAMFESIPVVIPENFDAYLTQKYGDWRSDPPVEKRKTHHNIVICDAERSYAEYIGQAD